MLLTSPDNPDHHVADQARASRVMNAVRPGHYALILVAAFVGTYLFALRTQGIFACQADGYGDGAYLAYCNATAYTDYDRGAFWYPLEPAAAQAAARADALFLGSSRMQFGLSTPAIDDWFSGTGASYYLLGFSYTETIAFTGPLLKRLAPRARVYVINSDRFFQNRLTPPSARLLKENVRPQYVSKQWWQHLHRPLCRAAPFVCGEHVAFFRRPDTGTWRLSGGHDKFRPAPVADGGTPDRDQWDEFTALARKFVADLPVAKDCVLLTLVPSPKTRRAEAEAIARRLGLNLYAPELPDLQTFDGSHLDSPSAARWSAAFFEAAGPQLRHCLEEAGPGLRTAAADPAH